jgi:putative phage-type endonuclease
MKLLKKLQLPEQRSKEWYEIREHLLTASSLADALGKGHFQTRDDLLIDKTRKDEKPFVMHDIMQWGVKYEQVATEFYENLHSLKIIEFGLIPHPQLSVFGASPDGICDIGSGNGYEGRMLEIKCPPKRKFTHEVPKHYWMQMQGQLEVCDLEECDFLQVKLEEYKNVNEYEYDCLVDNGIKHGKTKEGLPKGLVIAYTKKNELKINIEYKYSPWGKSLDHILNWRDSFLQELTDDYKIYDMNWWKITRYECTLVRRDKEWWLSVVPDIINFWDEVVHYREVGNEAVQKKIDGRKRKPKFKKVFTIPILSEEYQLDTDEEN